MKARTTLAALLITLAPAIALAQSNSNSGVGDSSAQNGNSAADKGNSGWGGAAKSSGSQGHPIDQTTGKEVEVHDEALAKNRTPLASGQDLKGPPVQLPPSKIPE